MLADTPADSPADTAAVAVDIFAAAEPNLINLMCCLLPGSETLLLCSKGCCSLTAGSLPRLSSKCL